MVAKTKHDIFLEVAQLQGVLDRSTLDRLLRAVPRPEDAIRYLLDKQLIDAAIADRLKTAYRKAAAAVPAEQPPPAVSTLPSPPSAPVSQPVPPPRPAANNRSFPQPAKPSQPKPETSEVDAFDALIDEILND